MGKTEYNLKIGELCSVWAPNFLPPNVSKLSPKKPKLLPTMYINNF